MPRQQVLSYLRAEPFRPFRIHMASGRTFDIRHPEMLWVGGTTMIIFTYVSDNPDVFDQWDTVSLMLVESISYLEPAVA
ncbi:MAG: hypothetical protein HYS13_11545 [Planctomycetia bacterium]|nr:hypothetical protein [Planctomycetia bacterium]